MKNGSMDNSTSNSNIKDYIKSKFITISKYIKTKLDISGGHITGDINMNNNSIINVKEPQSDNEVITKGYVSNFKDELSNQLILDVKREIQNTTDTLEQEIFDGDELNGNSILTWQNICNARFQLSSYNDDLSVGKLLKISNNLLTICNKYTEDYYVDQYKPHFELCLAYVKHMRSIYKNNELDVGNLKNCKFVVDLKVSIVNLIENMPESIFLELKNLLREEKLYTTPDLNSIGGQYRVYINTTARTTDPNRSNAGLELLIQKNLLILDIGIVYYIDNLLYLLYTLRSN